MPSKRWSPYIKRIPDFANTSALRGVAWKMAMLFHALVRISCESLRLATAPINRIDPSSDRPMKARIGPVDDMLHQTVL